ncbi:MAG: hypothetical protein ACTHJI_04190 [Leifsonia sp.]
MTLDDSEFMGKLAAADAAARKLGSVDPDVRVGADTAAADSKLAATAAAAKKLGASSPNIQVKADVAVVAAKLAAVEAAQRKLALATEGTQLAYLRLDAIQNKEGASALQLAAAHLAASRAEETEKSATDRLAGAKLALAAVEDAAAAATDDADGAEKKANATHATSVQKWQLIAAAVAALLPLLGPLIAYAVGVGGALAGMGAAGVLAIYGITQAIKNATIVGDQYKAGLNQLKGGLDSLGNTAANSMLQYFGIAVQMINRALPDLNRQIATFSNILGQTGLSVLDAVISAFHILNPLFIQGAQYVRTLAAGFNSWVQNGGLEKFANYAIANLPRVGDMLQSLVGAVLHLVVAFAPIGQVVVGALKLLGDAITAIPAPVLRDVAAAATAGFVAFKLWALIQPILSGVAKAIGAVGIATQLAEGPIGWVTAGISALAAVLAVGVSAMQDQAAAASDYAQALQEDNGAIKENVRLTAVKNLHDSGAIKAGHEIGLTTSQLTEAALGNAAAMKTVSDRLDEARKSMLDAGYAGSGLSKNQGDLGNAISTVANSVGEQNKALASAKIIQKENQDALSGANDTMSTNVDLLDAMKTATDQAKTATDELSKKLKGLGQVNLDVSSANTAFNQAVADQTASLAKNGATLALTTQAGRDNQRALDDMASSGRDLVAAQAAVGASADTLTGTMQSVHDQFVKAAVAAGMSRDAAEKLATQYGLVPKDVTSDFNTSGIPQAQADAAALQAQYDALERTYTIHVNTIVQRSVLPDLNGAASGNGRMGTFRDGGTIHAATGMTMPGGGSSHIDSIPTMLAPLEEVISNRFGQASNNRMLLKAINGGANRMQLAALANRQAGVQPVAQQPRNEPIYADGIGLIGWVRQIAGQQAQLVWNSGMNMVAQQLQGGSMY